ncbi:MAG: nitroreductase family protein [Desulfobacterales bacterium]
MSGLLKEIASRRAKRALSPEKISPEIVDHLMTAATYAPSCNNKQPWRLMGLSDPAVLEKIHPALAPGNYWAKKAPLIVVVATQPAFDAQLNDGRDYALYDCGLAAMTLMLQAEKEGLIAHPMAGFDPLAVKAAFDIPEEYIVINLIAVGFPGDLEGLNEKHVTMENSTRSRKPEAEVICRDSWKFH